MKKVIFLGLGDVLLNTRPTTIEYLNYQYDAELTNDEFYSGKPLHKVVNEHLPDNQKVKRKEFYNHFVKNFLQSREWHSSVRPVIGAQEVLPELAKMYDLFIVSARQKAGKEVVYRLLKEYFSAIQFSGIHFASSGASEPGSKHSYIARQPGEKVAYLDDNPLEIKKAQNDMNAILFDVPGVHKKREDIDKRIGSWNEVADELLVTV